MAMSKTNKLYMGFRTLKQIFTISPGSCFAILICSLVAGAYTVLSTYVIGCIFDNAYLINESIYYKDLFGWYVELFIAIFIIKNVSEIVINSPRAIGIYSKCAYVLDANLSNKITRLPFVFFELTECLDKLKRAKDTVAANRMQKIFLRSVDILVTMLSMIGTLIVLSSYSWILIPLCVLSILPFYITRKIRGNNMYNLKYFRSNKRRRANYLWGLFFEIKAIKELRVFNAGKYIYQKWKRQNDELLNEETDFYKRDTSFVLLCEGIKVLGILISIVTLWVMMLNGLFSVGVFAACLNAFYVVQSSLKSLLENLSDVRVDLNYAVDYFSMLDMEEETKGETRTCNFNHILSMKNISFRYPGNKNNVLNNISLDICKGDKVVIVGENGGGKSTLIKILLGLYKPQRGKVFVDNDDIQQVEPNTYHKLFSIVTQEVNKYVMSIKENIVMGTFDKEEIENECLEHKIEAMMKQGELAYLVDKAGLDSLIGKDFGGIELSGGEWQKLAILRAKIRDSDVLVMDEPTAALDPILETQILQSFFDDTTDKTIVIVSHRVGICKFATKIVVMKKGNIIDVGTHEELIKRCEYYRFLYTEQQKWYI